MDDPEAPVAPLEAARDAPADDAPATPAAELDETALEQLSGGNPSRQGLF